MNTLIFHHGALGDGVLIWPLLRAWAPCVLVGRASRAALAARWIDGLTWLDADSADASALFANGGRPDDASPLAAALQQADRIVSFISTGDDRWATNVAQIAPGAQVTSVQPRPAESGTMHISAFHLLQLHAAGVPIEPLGPSPRSNPDGPVVIHPGSGGLDKCWPADRFEALLDHLTAIGREAWVILGEAEREQGAADPFVRWRSRYPLHEPTDLLALSQLIARAGVYVGNDAGPTHLAAQLGVPTIALFGPTDPNIWQPRGPTVRVVAPPSPRPMNWLPVEPVIELLARTF